NASGLHDENGNPLVAGHAYRFQVMTHDGDQNKPGGDAGERCTTLTIPAQQQPSIAITKTADATPVSPGTSVGFHITVGNNGPTTATGVTLSDTLPSLTGITWTIASQTGSGCSINGPAGAQFLACSIGDMTPGATYDIHITSPTTAATAGSLPNTACVSASNDGTVCDLA